MSNRFGKAALAGAGALVLAVFAWKSTESRRDTVAETVSRVPAAEHVFQFRGNGFKVAAGGYASEAPPTNQQDTAHSIVVAAPARAHEAFEVRDGQGGARAEVRLVGAARSAARLERGRLIYADAYPDVDVVGARDPDRFELAYIAHTTRIPKLALSVGADAGTRLELEAGSGAAILKAADGRPKLRVERPVAFDAAGQTRFGSYVVADTRTLELRLDVEGLVPPLVIDPGFFIPFWTLTSDSRAPGGLAFDPGHAERQSRETQIVVNTATGKPWLIRPAASQGLAYNMPLGWATVRDYYLPTSTTPRISGNDGPVADELLLKDFERTLFRQSEVYEWRNNGWQLLPQTGLAGFIDPAVAFDSGRGQMVVIGGRFPGFSRLDNFTAASAVFEFDGNSWRAKGVPGGPSPRVRAASIGFGSKIVVFGGRTLETPYGQIASGGGLVQTVISNSTLEDLLNDTWTYDGFTWRQVPTSNPPPACERSQLIHDTRRDRVVLVGGNCAFTKVPKQHPSDFDGFRLWEFDGADWMLRFDIDDPKLPRSFRLRRGVAATWNPLRKTTLLFGGFVDVAEHCPLTTEELTAQRAQAQHDISFNNDFALKTRLQSQGCWGGYAQDVWEWDGVTLRALTNVAFGGFYAERGGTSEPIFQQISGAVPPPSAGVVSRAPGVDSKLWPWRYDANPNHFAQRSVLERTASQPGAPIAPAKSEAGQAGPALAPGQSTVLISPQFAPRARPQLVVAPDTGKLLIFFSGDGRVFETNLATWTDRTPQTSPFASGNNDLIAAAWDSKRKLAVIFDPITGATWERGDTLAWRRIETATSPGVSFTPRWQVNTQGSQLPRMTYDRARSRIVMIHRSYLWEYNGATWTQFALPTGLATQDDGTNPKICKAALLLAFDGLRNRTVLVGCSVPAQTWEWDGTTWSGPFGSPFQARILRQFSLAGSSFTGTLEGSWAHPNALVESPALGGVGIVDADGTLRIWRGSTWEVGPRGDDLVTPDSLSRAPGDVPYSYYEIPNSYYPPLVEDFSGNRILAFRDGIRGLRELSLSVPAQERQWKEAFVGNLVGGFATVHPFPMELLPIELTLVQGWPDPATATRLNGEPAPNSSLEFPNLFWPFRLLPDPTTKRVRLLTHRGTFWELGSERVSGTGEACSTSKDCKAPDVCLDGVCCQNSQCNGACLTCNGAHPGTCEPIAAGAPDPQARCGAGECAGTCSGVLQSAPTRSSCTHPGGRSCGGTACTNGKLTGTGQCKAGAAVCLAGSFAPQACPGGLACRDATSCKTTCASSADCAQRTQLCAGNGVSCVSDGKLCHSDGDCPSFKACSGDGMSCNLDRAALAAAAINVTPSTWAPPPMRSLQEIADLLHDEGYERDDQGRILLRDAAVGGVIPTLDPNLKTPLMGLRSCVYRIQACALATGKMDQCVAGVPRCQTETPWLGDPAGIDCCPLECLADFLETRKTESSFRALSELTASDCYPGLRSYYQELGQ